MSGVLSRGLLFGEKFSRQLGIGEDPHVQSGVYGDRFYEVV
jgi:hypothetical protein